MKTCTLLFSFFLLNLPAGVYAQNACSTLGCTRDTLILNTGYNHNSGSAYTIGSQDAFWQLVEAPLPITLPSPVWTIPNNAAWSSAFANSQWVSAYNYSSYNTNNPAPNPPFTFRACFCTCQTDSVSLKLDIMADDIVEVFMDGTSIGNYTGGWYFLAANKIQINKKIYLQSGTHCLSIKLRNTGGVAMGLNVSGYATGGAMLNTKCCNPTSSICGSKFNDTNKNGQRETSPLEAGIKRWKIYLRNSMGAIIDSTLTDTFGNYCFINLSAGNYIVSEQDSTGWFQTLPGGSNFHNIALDSNEAIEANFGNALCPLNQNDSIGLNTGYNYTSNSLYNQDDRDPLWIVTQTPVNTPVHYSFVVNASNWAHTQPNSKWIGKMATPTGFVNGTSHYTRCFCLKAGFTNPLLHLEIRADDSAVVFLNGTQVGTVHGGSFGTVNPGILNITNAALFQTGKNCITIRVIDGGVATGLNVSGYIKTGNTSAAQQCCGDPFVFYPDSCSRITGKKYEDVYGDGIINPPDHVLANWTFILSNGQTVTTNANGVFSFENLPAGTYTITENNTNGWRNTSPTNHSFAVTIGTGVNSGGYNFLNQHDDSTASISGVKFNDLNENGIRDPGEPGIPNWSIVLSTGQVVTTNFNGEFTFSSLAFGNYTVTEIQQNGWYVTYPSNGIHQVSLNVGQQVTGILFGNRKRCFIDSSISINTGLNPIDDKWSVTSDPDPLTFEPRQAFTIAPNILWSPPIMGSNWIHGTTSSTSGMMGTYTYERCFCLKTGAINPTLNLDIRADEDAQVFLNGNPIGSAGPGSFSAINPTTISTSSFFVAGRNCITVNVTDNMPPIRSGLDIAGTITTTSDSSLAVVCCDALSSTGAGAFNKPNVKTDPYITNFSIKEKWPLGTDTSKSLGTPAPSMAKTAWLGQNIPNPFSQTTYISYFIPEKARTAFISIVNSEGIEIKRQVLQRKGNGTIIIESNELKSGSFYYRLFVDNQLVDTKKMIFTK